MQATLPVYFQFLANLLSHPSRKLAQSVLKDLNKILREPFTEKLPWMAEFTLHLLNVYSGHIVRVVFDEDLQVCFFFHMYI